MAGIVRVKNRYALELAVVLCSAALTACGAMGSKPTPTPFIPEETPVAMPTVPPPGAGSSESGTPVPLPTRPLENPESAGEKKAGKAVGPVISFLGVARADGKLTEPTGTENGIPVFTNFVGSGFILLVEGKPGISNLEVGRKIFTYDEKDASKRADLEVQ